MDPAPLSIESIQQNSNRIGQLIYILFHIKTFLKQNDVYSQIKQFLFNYTEQDLLIDFRKAMSAPMFVKRHPPLLITLGTTFSIGNSIFVDMNLSYLTIDLGGTMIDSPNMIFYQDIQYADADETTFFVGVQIKKTAIAKTKLFRDTKYKFKTLKFKNSERFISSKNILFSGNEYNFYSVDNYAMPIDELKKTELLNVPDKIKKNMLYIFCKYDL